jgi:hypothetical protein
MVAALAIVLAQTCAGMLPKPGVQLDWLRNGKTYAHDEPVDATTLTRTYRRTITGSNTAGSNTAGRTAAGRTAAKSSEQLRTLSCRNGAGGVVLTETVDNEQQAELPLAMKWGDARMIDGAVTRRIPRPENGASNAFWFAVTRDAARIYAARSGIGIVEVRAQSATGGVDIFRAVPSTPDPVDAAVLQRDSTAEAELYEELARLQSENTMLRDSLDRLNTELRRGAGVTDPQNEALLSFDQVHALVRRDRFAEAIALLVRTRSQIDEYALLTGTEHPAAQRVETKLREVIRACLAEHPATADSAGHASVCAIPR